MAWLQGIVCWRWKAENRPTIISNPSQNHWSWQITSIKMREMFSFLKMLLITCTYRLITNRLHAHTEAYIRHPKDKWKLNTPKFDILQYVFGGLEEEIEWQIITRWKTVTEQKTGIRWTTDNIRQTKDIICMWTKGIVSSGLEPVQDFKQKSDALMALWRVPLLWQMLNSLFLVMTWLMMLFEMDEPKADGSVCTLFLANNKHNKCIPFTLPESKLTCQLMWITGHSQLAVLMFNWRANRNQVNWLNSTARLTADGWP